MSLATDLAPAISALRSGGVIACPSEAVWGLSCDPENDEALAHLMRMKERDPAKGVILVAANVGQFQPWLSQLPLAMHAPLAASWPGPNTWLVPDYGHSHGLVRGAHERVALRVTAHPVMKALCEAFGGPLVSTSANRSGEPPAMSAAEITNIFGDEVAHVVQGELGGNAKPSTIRDLVTGKIMRS